MARALLHQLLVLVFAVVIALLLGGLVQWALSSDFADAFLVQSPQLQFTFMDVGLIAFAVLLLIGGLRRKGLGWGTVGTVLAALLAAVVNLIVVAIIAIAGGGADIFYIAIGLEAGAIFVLGAVLATLIARRILPV